MPNHKMIVVSFDDEFRADEVLDTLKQMEVMPVAGLKGGTVVLRGVSSKVTVKETSGV